MFRTPLLVGTVLALVGAHQTRAADPVAMKLIAAKEDYDKEVRRLGANLTAALEKAEEAARTSGNKPQVDKAKDERTAWVQNGKVPPGPAGAAYERDIQLARQKMEAAFKTAIAEYLRAKQDDEAASVEAALNEFKRGDGERAEPQAADRKLWVHRDGYFMKGVGKDWFEKWDNGKQPPKLFHETQRNAEFVELQGAIDQVTCRLYKDKVMVKFAKQTEFKQVYRGEWQPQAK